MANFITNTSYTNSDFNSIYEELLKIVPQLTNNWNPESSNEADAGVVLLKLMAFIGDKNNYNIDKTILEHFPQTVTQTSNARQLYDLLGYKMHWYRSATGVAYYNYNGDFFSEDSGNSFFNIPIFTQICDANSESIYTILGANALAMSDILVQQKNQQNPLYVIEGNVQTLTINGSTTITLKNLDSNNRIYFSEPNVAENGIFVRNISESWGVWQQISNLYTFSLNNKVFTFGIKANTNQCYIEFPKDISDLISDGLEIKYVLSHGVDGNINSNKLIKFYTDVEITDINGETSTLNSDNSTIINSSAFTNGANPESISEAYESYEKQVGTFHTLVSCQDYINYINTLMENNERIVSNNVVSDRTNDINTAQYIRSIGYAKDENVLTNSVMNAFNLALYPLTKQSSIMNETTYNQAFTASTKNIQISIQNSIENVKSCQHDYFPSTYAEGERPENYIVPYIFKAFYGVNGKVTTFNKVTDSDATDIQNNVKQALLMAFSADKVEFGEAIDYNKLVEVVKSADARINNAIIDEPKYEMRVMDCFDTLGTYDTSFPISEDILLNDTYIDSNNVTRHKNLLVSTIERNILSGHANLYNFDDDFFYDYGITNYAKHTAIKYITTHCRVPVFMDTQTTKRFVDYTLLPNESIALYAPNLVVQDSYQAYCKLYPLAGLGDVVIQDGENYELGNNMLAVEYSDKNNNLVHIEFTEGTIVCPSGFEISASMKNMPASAPQYYILGAKDVLDIKTINKVSLNVPTMGQILNCYWITQHKVDGMDVLFDPAKNTDGTVTLKDGEYFIYADQNQSEMVILGNGTTIKFTTQIPDYIISIRPTVSAEEILSNGISALYDKWYSWDLSADSPGPIEIVQNQIITLTENMRVVGDVISSSSDLEYVDEVPCKVENIRYYQENSSEPIALPNMPTNASWQFYPTLNFNVSPILQQDLVNPEDWADITSAWTTALDHQEMEVFLAENETSTPDFVVSAGKSILTNVILIKSGGHLSDMYSSSISGVVTYPLSMLEFIFEKVTPNLGTSNLNYFRNLDVTYWKKFVNGSTYTYAIQSTEGHSANERFVVGKDEVVTVTEYKDGAISRYYKYTVGTVIQLQLPSAIIPTSSPVGLGDGYFVDIQGVRIPVQCTDEKLIPFIVEGAESTCKYDVSIDSTYHKLTNIYDNSPNMLNVGEGTYIMSVENVSSTGDRGDEQHLYIVKHDSDVPASGRLFLGKISIVTGYSDFVPTEYQDDVREYIHYDCQNASRAGVSTEINAPFNYVYRQVNSLRIESTNLISANAFFDVNCQFNRWVIPQIDTDNINVTVATSSRQ